MARKIISTLLIVAGLMIIAYPKGAEIYLNYRQSELMEEWEESLSLIDDNSDIEDEEVDTLEIEGNTGQENEELEDRGDEFNAKGIEGMLSIEKIDLRLPVLTSSTKSNLRKSVASIDKTGKLGEIGNYAIAGHRNRTYGSIFNRLDEVGVGDHIGLYNGETEYDYTVIEKLYVKPEEVWVLNGNNKDKEVTLITCHPQINPTHRLIIKGKVID